jgi:HTH-type transcriptional regulator/antitoxin HipB
MIIGTTQELGTAVRARRKELKITQGELAMTCGTGLRFIVDVERGKPTCQIGKTLDVLQSLGLVVELAPLGPAATGGRMP